MLGEVWYGKGEIWRACHVLTKPNQRKPTPFSSRVPYSVCCFTLCDEPSKSLLWESLEVSSGVLNEKSQMNSQENEQAQYTTDTWRFACNSSPQATVGRQLPEDATPCLRIFIIRNWISSFHCLDPFHMTKCLQFWRLIIFSLKQTKQRRFHSSSF